VDLDITKLMIRAPRKAVPKVGTTKPGTSWPARYKSTALISRIPSPKVNMTKGSVKRTRIGLMMALKSARTRATIRRVGVDSTAIASSSHVEARTPINRITALRRKVLGCWLGIQSKINSCPSLN
jgi:hypothetical protein